MFNKLIPLRYCSPSSGKTLYYCQFYLCLGISELSYDIDLGFGQATHNAISLISQRCQ